MWFWLAIIALLCWSGSDLFSKIGCRDGRDKYNPLKMVIAVGVVMGIHAAYEIFVGGAVVTWHVMWTYLPVSLLYIGSMTLGYVGLRYIELSISSPICNSSGALVAVLCLITGTLDESITGAMRWMVIGAVALVCIGVLTALGTMAGKQRTRGSAARMAWLLGAVLLSCAGDLLYEVMHEVEASTMKAMITWKNPWPFAAMYWGVPLLRLLGGLPSIFLMKRNPAGGVVLLAVGLAGCLLCLLEWFGVPLSIAAGQNRTLTVFALLLFGGIRCVLPERNLVCQSKS